MEEVVEEADTELVVVEVVATQLVEEEDAEVEVIAVTTQLVEEDAEVEVIIVATQLVEEEDAELVEADAVIIAEMEAGTERKKRRCASMALRRNTEVPRETMRGQ
jgi:hypothetical protein